MLLVITAIGYWIAAIVLLAVTIQRSNGFVAAEMIATMVLALFYSQGARNDRPTCKRRLLQ